MIDKIIKNLFNAALCVAIIITLAWALPYVGFAGVVSALLATFTGITIGGTIRCIFINKSVKED